MAMHRHLAFTASVVLTQCLLTCILAELLPIASQKHDAMGQSILQLKNFCLQVSAIDTCAREPIGATQCSKIQGEFGEEPSSGVLGKAFFGS